MNVIMTAHIAGGIIALVAGAMAVAARKGGRLHARTGTWFFGSMLALGVTASILEPFRTPPGSPIGGIMVCYFVATSWVAARRRDGTTGRFEIVSCAAAVGIGALTIWGGIAGIATTPVGVGPVFALGGLCLLAGLLDLNAIRRSRLSPSQRLARHLWRMCFAFFIATGSFFLGQQDVMPEAVRGSPILFLIAFAPFVVMGYWLTRVRLAKTIRTLSARIAAAHPARASSRRRNEYRACPFRAEAASAPPCGGKEEVPF